MEENELSIHESVLLKIDEAIGDKKSPHRDRVNGGVRADLLANSMEGLDDRPAADYAYAIRDLRDSGDVADLGNLRLTEKGASRIRELRARSVRREPAERVAFLLMPFDESFDQLKKSIIEAGQSVGVRIKRADDIFSGGIILDQIEEEIRAAAAIIAVCTGQNANVFYELGIARQWHDKPILLAAKKDDLPFDVRHYRAILYEAKDMNELTKEVAAAILETIPSRSVDKKQTQSVGPSLVKFERASRQENGDLYRTEVRGAIETGVGTAGPRQRVVTDKRTITNYRIPITNVGAPLDSVRVHLVEIDPQVANVTGEVPLHVTHDNPPLEQYVYKQSFPMGEKETVHLDLAAMDNNDPKRCYIWNTNFEDAVQEVTLGGTHVLTLRAYTGTETAEAQYRVYADGLSARFEIEGPLT
jgi:hypothetical protein